MDESDLGTEEINTQSAAFQQKNNWLQVEVIKSCVTWATGDGNWGYYCTGSTGEQQQNKGSQTGLVMLSVTIVIPGEAIVSSSLTLAPTMTGVTYSTLVWTGILGNIKQGTLLLSQSAQLGSLPLISALVRHISRVQHARKIKTWIENARENLALASIPS